MSLYRRAFVPGGTYFFVVNAHDRRPMFEEEYARRCLRLAWREARDRRPFETVALCLLPEHLHCIWTLPEGDSDYSTRWRHLKSAFSRHYHEGRRRRPVSESRHARRSAGLWQVRFWEHAVKNEGDFHRHLDYIHYNPVKHGLAKSPLEWPWSTFKRFVRDGMYEPGWGSQEPESIEGMDCEGE
jgi:putative transposase